MARSKTKPKRDETQADPLGPLQGPADDLRVLVIGTNQCWGMAATLDEAKKNAQRPSQYNVFIAHKDSKIHQVDGSIQYPTGFKPWLIHSKGIK